MNEEVTQYRVVLAQLRLFLFLLAVTVGTAWMLVAMKATQQSLLSIAIGQTVLAGAIGVLVYRRGREFAQLQARATKGRAGEAYISQALEPLGLHGFRAVHDIPVVWQNGRVGNIDHVLVGPPGIFLVETKYRSKTSANDRVHVNSTGVTFGRFSEPEIVPATMAKLNRLRMELQSRTKREWKVQAIVAVPGWYVNGSFTNPSCWVLNESAIFSKLVEPSSAPLTSAEIDHLHYHVRQIVLEYFETKAIS